MIDTTKAKADAEEGLRIAEKATEGPWVRGVYEDGEPGEGPYGVHPGSPGEWVESNDVTTKPSEAAPGGSVIVEGALTSGDATFIADARTRAPEAYRNVLALAEENERLLAERDDLESRFAEMSVDYREEHRRCVALGVQCDDLRGAVEAMINERDAARRETKQEAKTADEMLAEVHRIDDTRPSLHREIERLSVALIAIKSEAAADRGYPLIDRIIALVDASLAS